MADKIEDIGYTRMGYKVEGVRYWVCSSCEMAPPFSYVDFHTFNYHLSEELRQKVRLCKRKGRNEFPEVLEHCTDTTFTVAKDCTYSFKNLSGTTKLGLKRKDTKVDPNVDNVVHHKIVDTGMRESATGTKSSGDEKADVEDTSWRIDALRTESEDAQDMEIRNRMRISSVKLLQSQRVEKSAGDGQAKYIMVDPHDVLPRRDESSIASTSKVQITTGALEDKLQRFEKSKGRLNSKQLGQPATLNQEANTDNPRRTRPKRSSARTEFESQVIIDEKTCQDMADSIEESTSRKNTNGTRSLRGRKRKPILHDSLSSLVDIAVGALENKLHDDKSKGKRKSINTYKRKKKPEIQESPSATSITNCDSNPPDKAPETPDVAVAIEPYYVIPKGFSPDEKILREVTSEEFNEALANLSLEDKPVIASSAFGEDFALKVWQLYNQNKNIREIQAALKCGWNDVQRRINDSAYVDEVVEVLKQHSSRFRERLSALEKEHNDDLTKSAGEQNGATADNAAGDGCPQHTELSNGLKSDAAVSEANQSEQEVAKPKFQILFPMLQNASIRKAGELLAKKPLEYPKAPMITKKVLDDQSGMFIDVTVPLNADDEEDPPNIKAALLIPWPDEDEINESSADDDHIRQMEKENRKLLDKQPTYPKVEAYETPGVGFVDGSAAGTVSDTEDDIKIISVFSVPAQSNSKCQPRKPAVSNKLPSRKRKRSNSRKLL